MPKGTVNCVMSMAAQSTSWVKGRLDVWLADWPVARYLRCDPALSHIHIHTQSNNHIHTCTRVEV